VRAAVTPACWVFVPNRSVAIEQNSKPRAACAVSRYLADPLLGSRLRHDVRLMMSHEEKSALDILGSPDDLKFRSCLTLFAEAASDDADHVLFNQALDQFYGGNGILEQ